MRRPPWWPQNEQWPPEDAAGWRELRRGYMVRAGCFFGVMALLFALAIVAVLGLLSTLLGSTPGTLLGVVVALVVIVVGVRVLLTAFRSTAMPTNDLIDAARRVESGELDVQVPERGSPEMRAFARSFNAMSARLSATERERRRLLAEISHELRTPLTVIEGNIEAMIDGLYPADREHLERVQAEARQLERLIDDLRTVSLAETGQLPLQLEPTDVVALAREVVEGLQAEADEGDVALSVDAVPDLPEQDVDARRIRQVIANLVTNALRYTPRGGTVVVSVARDGNGFRLAVADTGSGMSAYAVQHAFDRFWREGESAGAGLGLAIVRDLVAAHGGSVAIQSRPAEGTTVTALFPG
jgi:signal transduction histidine kinase